MTKTNNKMTKTNEEMRFEHNLHGFFNSHQDILTLNNHTQQYEIMCIDEFKESLKNYNELGFKISECNIQQFSRYPHGEFIHFTINKKDSNVYGGSDHDIISRIAFTLNLWVCGHTFVMTEHNFENFKEYLYNNITIEH